jgi:hypothetical protein
MVIELLRLSDLLQAAHSIHDLLSAKRCQTGGSKKNPRARLQDYIFVAFEASSLVLKDRSSLTQGAFLNLSTLKKRARGQEPGVRRSD